MITLTQTNTSSPIVLTLPENLCWSDEFNFDSVAQQRDVSTTGAMIVQETQLLGGRPITLTTDAGGAWIARADLLPIYSAAQIPAATWVLTLNDSRTFSVIFRRDSSAPAVVAVPVFPASSPSDDDEYQLTINLITTVS